MNAQLAEPLSVPVHSNELADEPLYEVVGGRKVEVQPLAMRSNVIAMEIIAEWAHRLRIKS